MLIGASYCLKHAVNIFQSFCIFSVDAVKIKAYSLNYQRRHGGAIGINEVKK
jgi:hypothetical protein